MSIITQDQFVKIFPRATNPGTTVGFVTVACSQFGITTKRQVAAFLAQCGHENGGYTNRVENLNYKVEALLAKFSRERISEADARKYGRIDGKQPANQEMIANTLYGGPWGSKNLGNTVFGDGWKYRGRGDIQTTGKSNYTATGKAIGIDLLNNPDQLSNPQYAALSAAYFFKSNGLNELAEKGDINNVSSVVNTGKTGRVANGAEERKALYESILKVLG